MHHAASHNPRRAQRAALVQHDSAHPSTAETASLAILAVVARGELAISDILKARSRTGFPCWRAGSKMRR